MSYKDKRPPIRVIITIEEFNKLVEFLFIGEKLFEGENVKYKKLIDNFKI